MNGRSCSSSAVGDRGMESDVVFRNFLVRMELLSVLQTLLAIPNLSALPVHYAKQVPSFSSALVFTSCFPFSFEKVLVRSRDAFRGPFRVVFGQFWCHFDDF